MPLPLAELKGRAVLQMNSEPVIALARGHTLPRNFVIEVERAWGYPALRFGEKVFLLAVPGQAPGLLAGEDTYLVLSNCDVDAERQRLIAEPEKPVTIEGMFPLPDEAIAHAANIAASWEFVQRAIAGHYVPKSEETPEEEPKEEEPVLDPAVEEARAALDHSIFDSCSAEPPTDAALRPLLTLFRLVHGRNAGAPSDWTELEVTRAEIERAPTLSIGGMYHAFRLEDIPRKEFVEQEDVSLPSQAGIVLVAANRRRADFILREWLPSLPLARRRLVSVHTSWGYAVMKGCSEWLSHYFTAAFRSKLGDEDSE